MELTAAQIQNSASESQKLNAQLNGLGTQYGIAAQQTKNLESQLEAAKKVYGENSDEVKKLESRLLEAKTAEANFKNEIQATTKEIIAQGGRLGDIGDKLKTFGQGMESTGKTLTRNVTMPIVGVGAAVVTMAANFESGMSEVQAISQASAENMVMLEEIAKEMGATTKLSASEAAEG